MFERVVARRAAAPIGRATEGSVCAALVRNAQRGDRGAREELAAALVPVAYRFALQLLGNREEAADVSQETMLRFFSTLGRFDPARPLQPWVRRITYNQSIDSRRRARVRRTESLEEMGVEGLPEGVDRAAADPMSRLLRRELRHQLWRCLSTLQPAERDILVLREYQDLAYREIAELLGIPIGTVMSRLHSARKRLRSVLLTQGVVLPEEHAPGATASQTPNPEPETKEPERR